MIFRTAAATAARAISSCKRCEGKPPGRCNFIGLRWSSPVAPARHVSPAGRPRRPPPLITLNIVLVRDPLHRGAIGVVLAGLVASDAARRAVATSVGHPRAFRAVGGVVVLRAVGPCGQYGERANCRNAQHGHQDASFAASLLLSWHLRSGGAAISISRECFRYSVIARARRSGRMVCDCVRRIRPGRIRWPPPEIYAAVLQLFIEFTPPCSARPRPGCTTAPA